MRFSTSLRLTRWLLVQIDQIFIPRVIWDLVTNRLDVGWVTIDLSDFILALCSRNSKFTFLSSKRKTPWSPKILRFFSSMTQYQEKLKLYWSNAIFYDKSWMNLLTIKLTQPQEHFIWDGKKFWVKKFNKDWNHRYWTFFLLWLLLLKINFVSLFVLFVKFGNFHHLTPL